MKKMMTALAAFTLVAGVGACSESADTAATADAGSIAGEWLINLDSASFENDNRDWTLADGQYQCDSCNPPFGFAANGEWQTVDRPGSDSQMIEVVDERTVKFASRLNGEDMGSSTLTISEDGNSAVMEWTDLSGDAPVNGKFSMTRTAAGPEGSHAMSGKWAVADIESMDEAGLRYSVALDGDMMTNSGNGQSWTAQLGGEPVAIEGDNAGTMVAGEKTGDNGYRETYSRDGEVLSVAEITIEGDTLSGKSTDARDGSVVTWTATRQ